MNRQLTAAEMHLTRWMLEHAGPEAKAFLSQLEKAQATPWRCPCGCPSFNLSIQGLPKPSGPIHPLAEYVFGTEVTLSGVFVFEQGGVLAGVEVYGLAGDAPKALPTAESLRQFQAGQQM